MSEKTAGIYTQYRFKNGRPYLGAVIDGEGVARTLHAAHLRLEAQWEGFLKYGHMLSYSNGGTTTVNFIFKDRSNAVRSMGPRNYGFGDGVSRMRVGTDKYGHQHTGDTVAHRFCAAVNCKTDVDFDAIRAMCEKAA